MSLRRPVTSWSRGVLLCLVPGLLVAGCAAGPYAASPPAPTDETAACSGLMGSLPDTLAGEERREVTGGDGRVAAWGDPAIVLTCDVPLPDDFTDTSTCIEANGTGWFVPDAVLESDDETLDVTTTAVGFRPRVQVLLPGDYRPDGFQAVTGTIGRLVSDELSLEQRCR